MQSFQSTFNPYHYTQQFDQSFSFEKLYRHPGSLVSKDHRVSRKRIGIIGGGIAGLTSAYELSQIGHQVTLLEASERLGGRIRTHYFSDGSHGELGAMRIPRNHGCVQHYVEKFNLPIRPFVSYNPAGFYYLRGNKVRIKHFNTLFPAYKLTPQEYLNLNGLYDTYVQELIDTLSDLEKWEMFSSKFSSSRLKQYDGISFTQYFRDRLSPDAFELVGHATGMIHYDRTSLLGGLFDFYAWYQAEQYQIVGGMETLVNAFAQRLGGKIQCHAKVMAIKIMEQGVCVHWNQLERQEIAEFDLIICTVPTPALAQIEFNPPLPANKTQAVRSLGYDSAVKTLFHCTARPWELYDHIYGGGSFTDLPIEKCWYPFDNAQLEDERSQTPRWIACDPDLSHQSSAFTAAYRWGKNTKHFLALHESERTDSTLREVKQLHPQIEEYVDNIVHWVWDEETNRGSGAYAFFAPGEHERYHELLCQPYPLDHPRVFFAGEHLAINHASVQGAIQTALAATINVLASSIIGI